MPFLQPYSTFTLHTENELEMFYALIEKQIHVFCFSHLKLTTKIAIYEALKNAVFHGKLPVFVDFSISDDNLVTISITDSGNGFLVDEYLCNINTHNLDILLEDALKGNTQSGILIMKKLCDNVSFNKKGNAVTLVIQNI